MNSLHFLARPMQMGMGCLLVGLMSIAAVRAAVDETGYDPKSKELAPAPILVHAVHGDVTVTTHENPAPMAARNEEKLRQGCMVKTGRKSSVDLIFSNGTVVALDANSELSVNEFLQAGGYDISTPAHDGKTVLDDRVPRIGTIDKEPSYSRTKIFLQEGTMYVQVKHLHKKSNCEVGNPLGVSHILGTTWRQTVTSDIKERKKENSILLKEGLIKFQPIESQNQRHDAIFIHPGEQVRVSGIFPSVAAMSQIASVDSVNVNVNVSVDIAVEKTPIRDPEFLAMVAAFLPVGRDQEITSPNGPQQPNGPDDLNLPDALGTGDQGVGTVGTQIGGSGGGGGTSSNGANPAPAS